MSEERPMLELSGVVRVFEQAGTRLEVLRGASLAVRPGELVGLVGPSGAGKSTLLHIAGLLERPDEGTVRIGGIDASKLDDAKRTEIRRGAIGFVYQFHHLLPEFSAQENIVLPQMIAGLSKREATERARQLLAMVGLEGRASHRPARLSGGEQQRVAIARALANAPGLLIADEPTGNLDPHTAEGVFAMLTKLVRGARVGALIATHNLELAQRMDRVLEMRDGVLVEHA
ncbi:ABC transporter ATP-binding protein [Azospirillum sp.]|uniref:ABC transporter ATP-binding protein n=1 Tax=Azospirillum sp. TaxID=34012 RepID=UPI002D7689DE|nr:ABC transporter ATP-binding protein [Azospirillum sp.]